MPTNGEAVYIDSSALVKLFSPESESVALTRYLASRSLRVSALLLRTEVLRAAVRCGLSPLGMLRVHALLDTIGYVPADVALSDSAGLMAPAGMRSLDAIHVATARSLGTRLGSLVTYDQRLASAAAWYGIPVESPS
ncbi:MAG: type II toxin-antitoxin system VapC family toxin [Candidatus Dormibacteria bacterium]